MVENLLTVEQYANRTQMHPESVRRQIREGRLRAINKGRSYRIPESVLMESVVKAPDWTNAATRMATVYADSIASGGVLTACSTEGGDYAPTTAEDDAE